MKKVFSIILAGTMAASTMGISALSVSADEGGLTPGSYVTHPTYTPKEGVKTNRLMFAMPAAWQNETTKKDREGGLCGLYWWSGFDKPGDQGWSNGWPGYQATKVTTEKDVTNLWEINVPTYGNGEKGNATQIIWNNFIDGGTEKDTKKNPFYEAANQTKDFPGQYYSRTDEHETYDILIRYIYMKSFKDAGVEGIDKLDIKSDNFWVEANKLCAVYNENDWDKLDADERTYQVDLVLDDNAPDLSEFGDYASNFFNEDNVGADGVYPQYKAEEALGNGQAFTFNNMVFVVSFEPTKMEKSPVSGKIGYDGDWYFYYGNGEYGSWPTKELNEQYKGVTGNFTKGDYVDPDYKPPVPTDDPSETTIPSPSGTDAGSSTKDSDKGSDSGNDSNGSIATGQFSVAVIVLVVLFAGAAIVMFARKKEQD